MSAEVANETKKYRVLLVDDEPVTLRVQTAMLKLLEFECVTASSALEAQEVLQKLGSGYFDCLITDYLMPPGPTGIDLLIWLRNKSSSLAAIIITAQEERSLIAESMRTGATDFLDKPVTKDELKRAVQKACEITAKQRALSANYEAVQQLAQLRGMFCSLRPIEGCAPPDVIFFPKFELGGDFVNLCFDNKPAQPQLPRRIPRFLRGRGPLAPRHRHFKFLHQLPSLVFMNVHRPPTCQKKEKPSKRIFGA